MPSRDSSCCAPTVLTGPDYQSVHLARESRLRRVTLYLTYGSLGIAQFLHRRAQAYAEHANTYDFYLDGRITGFASHWMTFGGEGMIVLLMLTALVLFSHHRPGKILAWACLPLLLAAILLGLTRSVFLLGVPLGGLYLLWSARRRILLAIPAVLLAIACLASVNVRERVVSAIHPHGDLDSNSRRDVMRRAGWEMLKAHPWFGLGPEQIAPQFQRYVPPDVPRPLPKGWYGHLHNIYLQYAAERGIPGLLFLLWFIGQSLLTFLKALRRRECAPEARFVLYGAVAVTLAILAEGMFEYNLGDSEVLTLFLSVIGCAYCLTPRRTY